MQYCNFQLLTEYATSLKSDINEFRNKLCYHFEPLLAGNKLALCKMFSLNRHPEYQELNPAEEGEAEAGPSVKK